MSILVVPTKMRRLAERTAMTATSLWVARNLKTELSLNSEQWCWQAGEYCYSCGSNFVKAGIQFLRLRSKTRPETKQQMRSLA